MIAGLPDKEFAQRHRAHKVPCHDQGELFDHLYDLLGLEGQHQIDLCYGLWRTIERGGVAIMHDGTTTYLFGRTAKKGNPICSMN